MAGREGAREFQGGGGESIMAKTKTSAQYLQDRLLDVLKKYPECSGLTTIEVNLAPYYATRNWDATIIDANSLAYR
jgi:hypothetical protein